MHGLPGTGQKTTGSNSPEPQPRAPTAGGSSQLGSVMEADVVKKMPANTGKSDQPGKHKSGGDYQVDFLYELDDSDPLGYPTLRSKQQPSAASLANVIRTLNKDSQIDQFVTDNPDSGKQLLVDYVSSHKDADNYEVVRDWLTASTTNSPAGMVYGESTRYPGHTFGKWGSSIK